LGKLWFVDGRSGDTVSYAALLDLLNAAPRELRPLCQPTSTRDALTEVTAAIAADTELVLFDTDFGPREIQALGYDPGDLNRPTPAPVASLVTLDTLQRSAGGASLARIGLFTSGSTGLPKLVRQAVANLARVVRISPRNADAIWASAYNPTHVAGLQVYLQALANGCALVDVFGLGREQVLTALERHHVTHLSATPSFYRLLLPAERALRMVRSVTLGGESADARLIEKLRVLFPAARFHNVYASTEAGTLLVADGDVFAIAAGLEDRVIIREGRLHVHCSLLGQFAGAAESGEWYDTGDVVEVIAADSLRFRIVARERDWVNVGGSKVNPREVEAVLEEFPGVRKARVSGRPNSVLGHILCAELECHGLAPSEQAVREFASTRLQAFKIPRLIRCVDRIAQTRTGKLSRR
jgi:acyl-coenzyme A synthetase/AMP-(fatty) acid ligase